MNTKKFAGIDYFRFVAAFMVIAIHISPFAIWNKDVDYLLTYCLGRIAVPFFLMTTGYFVLAPFVKTNFQKKHSIHKYITKNTILYLSATLFYIPLALYSGNLPHSIGEFLKQLFFDGTFYHLWYFPAAIIGCILLIFLLKKSIGTAVIFSVIAYVIGLFGDSYYGIVKDVPFLSSLYDGIFHISSYTRNGIFFAPIFILLGVVLANPQFHCQTHICKIGFVLSLLLMFLEGFLTYSLGLQKHNSMYFLLIPTMYFMFQLLLYFPQQQVPIWLRNGSMLLYIIHPAVIVVVRGIAKITKSTKLLIDNTFIQYLTVCVLSLIIVFSIQFFLGRRRGRCIKKEEHGLN
ncbi:MAG: acyltransferase family protein [Lachnospiraceae bacterium]|nr:acyltransferase family protein [Lachnospiraceae bacterium]